METKATSHRPPAESQLWQQARAWKKTSNLKPLPAPVRIWHPKPEQFRPRIPLLTFWGFDGNGRLPARIVFDACRIITGCDRNECLYLEDMNGVQSDATLISSEIAASATPILPGNYELFVNFELDYAIVPGFWYWMLTEHTVPDHWKKAKSLKMDSLDEEDQRCCFSGDLVGLDTSSIIPKSQTHWSALNIQSVYSGRGMTMTCCDGRNTLPMRKDLSFEYELGNMLIVPLYCTLEGEHDDENARREMLLAYTMSSQALGISDLFRSPILAQKANIPPEAHYARFAWAIFNRLEWHSEYFPPHAKMFKVPKDLHGSEGYSITRYSRNEILEREARHELGFKPGAAGFERTEQERESDLQAHRREVEIGRQLRGRGIERRPCNCSSKVCKKTWTAEV